MIPFLEIVVDSENNVWSTQPMDNNLYKFSYSDLETDTTYLIYNPGTPGSRYGEHLNVDLNDNLWMQAFNGGYYDYFGLLMFNTSTEEWTFYDTTNSQLPSKDINSIAVDIRNNKWIGTVSGLALFNEAEIILPTQLTTKDTLNFEALIDSTVTKPLVIYNTTNENLLINSFDISLSEFSAIVSLPVTIPVSDSLIIFINFQPGAVEWYTGKLTLFTNKGMYIQVLSGNGVLTSVSNDQKPIAVEYFLKQNYPNPFNPATTIKYQIPETGFITLKVYDVLGNEVATFVNEEKPAGSYEIEFYGKYLPSGVYFYRMIAGNFIETMKMILLK
jgi:hypothetical protein